MVLGQKRLVTAAEFDQFVELPENADKLFDLISGEIVEVPSNPYASKVGSKFIVRFGIYFLTNDIVHLTGEQGGYRVSGERYAPDVGIVLKAKQSEL